ncbi:MAG: bifunctional anthranilate synthase component I family protein/class IV aminotransferase [Ilumatobacteraceae bacterium]|nr:bifunctional anthranilate synthase component I family protein/class IV aminotransferase [Ilumatobacteraceae bacterium]
MRLDDVARGVGYEFSSPIQVWVAREVDDVVGVIAAGEEAAEAGKWVVGFVTYEAARAFDAAYPPAAAAGTLPLAWFCSFASRREVPLVEAPSSGPFVDGVVRTHGSRWYRDGVQQVRELIETGGVYQINLTDRVRARLVAHPFDLYRSMVSTQGGSFNAFLDLGEAVVASASPELFLEIAGDTVTARPMKGTRRRHGRPSSDVLLAEELRVSKKDRAENVMIVDLLRNDLSRLSSPGGVSVPELFRVERYETVWQLTSTVQATLRPEIRLADVFRATFPCGSITGAPKVAAMHAIARLEPSPRGLYCGAIGMISPAVAGARPSSIWSVAIRTAVIDAADGRVEFASGGGITYDSVPADEDDELESKVAVLRSARPAFELFETLFFDAAGARHLARHLRRLSGSAEYFGFACDVPALAADVAAMARPAGPRRLRIVLDRRGRHRMEVIDLNEVPPVVGLAVSTARVCSDDPFMCHKTTRRAVYERARSAHPRADDVVLINERAEVVETTIANLLYRMCGEWFTPPLASGGLPGIGRELLLESGEVRERVLPVTELASCDELAVVNSLRGRRTAVILGS